MPGGLDIEKLIKPPMIYSVSYFDLGGFSIWGGAIFRASPPKLARGDGTATITCQSVAHNKNNCFEGIDCT